MKKRLFRRIKRNKVKLLMIWLMIFITSTLFVGYYVGTSSVLDSIYEFNKIHNLEKGIFFSEALELDDTDVEKIEYKDLEYGQAIIRIFRERKKINQHQILEGRDLLNKFEILLDENFMSVHKLQIGDNIKMSNNSFEICGVAIAPDYIMTKKSELILQPNARLFGIGFTDDDTFEKIKGNISFYYAYDNELSLEENIVKFSPITIRDTFNNSRVKQVIGDATSPQLLSIVVVTIFYIITIILLMVYHFENAKIEKNNVEILRNMGQSKGFVFLHYMKEILLVGNLAVCAGVTVGICVLPIIMNMNKSIYNYPILNISYRKLIVAVVVSFILINIVNMFVVRVCYFADKTKKVKSSKFSLLKTPSKKLFHYRYRLTYISRNKKEMLLYIVLIFMIGILINFCFLLKISVVEYVENLGKETLYNYLYFCDKKINTENKEFEDFKIYNLYDSNGVIQNVYCVNENSEYFKLKEAKVAITKAYADKYDYVVGDGFTLKDKINEIEYTFQIEEVLDIATVSEVYINREDISLNAETSFQYGYVSKYQNEELKQVANTCIIKEEVITSGENILNIINKQITMILVISIIIEIALMYSLLEFVYANVCKDIQILKLNGFSLSELSKMFFGYNTIICILTVISSFLCARYVVRIFLDNIMHTFVNYVYVTENMFVILLSNGIIFLIYTIFYERIRNKIKKEERK